MQKAPSPLGNGAGFQLVRLCSAYPVLFVLPLSPFNSRLRNISIVTLVATPTIRAKDHTQESKLRPSRMATKAPPMATLCMDAPIPHQANHPPEL